MRCPVCHGSFFQSDIPTNIVQREIGFREQFIHSRLNRKASLAELKDLTDFMHGFAAPIERCISCGLLIRAEYRVRTAKSCREDANDRGIMAQLLPRYVQAFRNKEPGFRGLLRPHAEILELGSHLGAFLQVAEEWDWRATGLDVGSDTAGFARSKGLTVRREMIEDASIPPRTYDAVFVWNCFEQIPDPARTLKAIRSVLRPHGLLVIRVPNAGFYRKRKGQTVNALAWNNLLGFPYLYGYTGDLVTRLAGRWGFEYVSGFNSELVTMPFPDLSTALAAEQKTASEVVAARSVASSARTHQLAGPWIEMVYRMVKEPVGAWRSCVDRHFLPRAA